MKRLWFLALALSLGLNAGLLYVSLSGRGAGREPGRWPPPRGEPAEPGGARRQRQPGPSGDSEAVIRDHLARMTRDLRLSESQRASISAVHRTLLPLILAERREMDTLRQQVSALYVEPAIDSVEFRGLVRQLSLGQARLDSLVTSAILGEAAVLTFDQRKLYFQRMPWGHPMAPLAAPPGEQGEGPAGGQPGPPPGGPPGPPPRGQRERPPSNPPGPGPGGR